MKVLVFTSLYPNNVWPNYGIFIKQRMMKFAAQYDDCQVVVVAPVPYYPPIKIGWRSAYNRIAKEESFEGVPVYHPRYFMVPKIGMFLHGLLMYLSVFSTVKRIQKSYPFDLIDAHYIYPDGFAAALLGRSFRRPLVVSARGSDINLFAEYPIVRRLLVYVLSRASHIITVSRALRSVIIGMGIPHHKISVIPNGVDATTFSRIGKENARQMLDLPPQSPMLLSVGGLTETKGFERLIHAFKIIVEESKHENPFLIVVGEGRSRKNLKALIATLHLDSHVRLVGAVPHEQLYLWYSAADVFCLASEREGWPNVLLEALSCGLPVVGTDVGGIPEIIATKDVGFLTRRDSITMASHIREAMQKNWDAAAITHYARGFTWESVASRVREVFDTVLKTSTLRNVGSAAAEKTSSFSPI